MSNSTLAAPELDAAIAALKEAARPLTAREIAAGMAKKANGRFNAQLSTALSQLTGGSGVYQWPNYARSPVFCALPIDAAIEAGVLDALADQPLTASKAAGAVAKQMRRLSESTAQKRIKPVLAGLLTSNRILSFAVNRQAVVYFSFAWLQRLAPPTPSASGDALGEAILEAMRELQPGEGNFVRVDFLRRSHLLRRWFDREVIGLADSGKVALTRYNGPRPVAEDEKPNYVEDAGGDLFIGVALRSEERNQE